MPERLYLSKDDGKEVFVDLKQPLPQHQLDGIRFLYRQFKLRNPGAILNDPTGYGKRLQVVLFLNAICPLLKQSNKPILILCNDSDVSNWKEHFEKWTDCFKEVIIDSPTPFTKNMIFINPHSNSLPFRRRQWAALVVDSEHTSKELLSFEADFKIWVISSDMKKSLPTFSTIYKWLYPKITFKMEDFTTQSKDRGEALDKALLLDAFLEDVVLRRKSFRTPFHVPEKVMAVTVESPRKNRASIKNKDPTGTKVKRSKKRKINENSTPTLQEVVTIQHGNNDNVSPKNINCGTTETLFDFEGKNSQTEVKSCHNPMTSFLQSNGHENGTILDTMAHKPNAKTIERETEQTEDSSVEFETAVNDIVLNENTTADTLAFTKDLPENDDEIEIIPESGPSWNKKTSNYPKHCVTDVESNINDMKSSSEVPECDKGKYEHKNQPRINDDIESYHSNNDVEVMNQVNEIKTDLMDMSVINESQTGDENVSKNNDNFDNVNNNDDDKSLNTPNKSILSRLKEVDDKVLKYEEQALKRFKGSFLDSMF